MPEKIAYLTKEQEARSPEWVEKWVEIGLSTAPADFARAEAAALRAYDLCKLARPAVVLWLKSPLEAAIGVPFALALMDQVWGQVRSQVVESQVESKVWGQVGNQVRSQVESQVHVWSQVRSQVESKVESQVWGQVGSQVGNQVRSQVGNVGSQFGSHVWSQVESQVVGSHVWSQVGSQVGNQVRSQVGNVWSQFGSHVWSQVESQAVGSHVWSQVGSQFFNNLYHGQFWAGWISFVSYLRDVCNWQNDVLERFAIEEELAKTCGYLWWHENVLAISDRPSEIHLDQSSRLHNEAGPSIQYRDGWSLYHWHGVSVPAEWITDKQSLDATSALKWENTEQRRAACEIIGWNRILRELDAKTINRDNDPQIGELVEVTLPNAGREKFLRVLCGTGREFAIPVPPNMQTALQANCWTYDLPENLLSQKEYRT